MLESVGVLTIPLRATKREPRDRISGPAGKAACCYVRQKGLLAKLERFTRHEPSRAELAEPALALSAGSPYRAW